MAESELFFRLFMRGYSCSALARLLQSSDFGNSNDHDECILEVEDMIRREGMPRRGKKRKTVRHG